MPKQLHEIREFSKGMVTSVSEGDIPDNAAQLSINIDPIAEFGVLKSLSQDQILSTNGFEDSNTGTEINVPASRISFINDSGTYHGIAMSSANNVGTITQIPDMYNTPDASAILSSNISSSQNTFTSVVNNKELHIGTGNTAVDRPKWVGMVGHPHFSDLEDSGIQIADSAIETTSVFNYVDDIDTDNHSIYGIHKENHRIYKFSIVDEEIISSVILDCEIIHCFTVWTDDATDPTHTRIYLMVEKQRSNTDSEYLEFNDKYRIMVLDNNLAILRNNIYYEIRTTDQDGAEKRFRICASNGAHGTGSENYYINALHMGISIKRVSYFLWLAIDAPQPIFDHLLVGSGNLFDTHHLPKGHWLLRGSAGVSQNPDLTPNDGETLTLDIKTPYGFADGIRSSTNSPIETVGGIFGTSNTNTDVTPTSAEWDGGTITPIESPKFKIKKLVSCDTTVYSGGDEIGIGVIGVVPRYGTQAPVLKIADSTTKYARIFSLYIIVRYNFKEVEVDGERWANIPIAGPDGLYYETRFIYQCPFLFTADPHTGAEALSDTECKVYHFGKRTLDGNGINTTGIDLSTSLGGWGTGIADHIESGIDMGDLASSIAVNDYANDHDSAKGVVATRKWSNGFWNDEYYIRSFTNPVRTETGIGWESGTTEVGHEVVFTDEREDLLINAKVVPESNDKLMYLLGESSTSQPKYGKLTSSGNWYDTGANLTLYELQQTDIEFTFRDPNLAISSTFLNGYTYFWKLSFLYDNYQESPLSSSTAMDADDASAADESFQITINLSNDINKRISHVIVYRGDSGGITAGDNPLGAYRQVVTIPLDSRWEQSGNIFHYTIIDSGSAGKSYEASSGLPQNILDVTPNYKLSTQLNNSHFIADIYSHRLGGRKSNFLLKSLPYSYDVFDWTKDFVQLPTTPVALSVFKGRVYAFDDNNTYRIEPNNLYIEDSFEGSGCIGHDSVVVTEYGMFYCDRNNVYRHDGNMPYPIADAILPTWTDLDFSYIPLIGFDSKRKSVIISVFDGTDYKFLVYNTFRKRWDIVTKANSTLPVTALFSSKEGDAVYIEQTENVSDYYYKLFSNTTDKRTWSWSSKELDMGTATLDKSYLNTVLTGNDALEDSDLSQFSVSTSNGALGKTYSSLGDGAKYSYSGQANRQSKTIKYVFTSVDGSIEVDSIGTAYRRL